MYTLLSYILIFSVVVYLLLTIFSKKIRTAKKILISLSVFIFLSMSLIALLIVNGDPPLPGSTIVYLDESTTEREVPKRTESK